MGVAPKFLATFVDQWQAVARWVGNSQFFADFAAVSPNAKSMTPVIALPLSSTAEGTGTPHQQFKAFAEGQHDGIIAGIVKVWAQRGFSNLVFWPGWEMNLTGPTYAGDDAQRQADWVRAFQQVYTVLHQAATANGVTVQVVWNLAATNNSNAKATEDLYPGDAYAAIIGVDNLWDSNGGGNYQFSVPTDGKPQEAAAWAKYFGAGSAPPAASVTLGSGAHALRLLIAEDAWQGDAQLTVSVDWRQIGGTQTAKASRAAGASQAFDVSGDLATAAYDVSVNFVNDAGGGTAATDRNLYVTSAKIDGSAISAASLTLLSAGARGFSFAVAAPPAQAALETLSAFVSQDAWQSDAQYTVRIDSATIGGTMTAAASHASGASREVSLTGSWGAGPHTVGIFFINDVWGDRRPRTATSTWTASPLMGGLRQERRRR